MVVRAQGPVFGHRAAAARRRGMSVLFASGVAWLPQRPDGRMGGGTSPGLHNVLCWTRSHWAGPKGSHVDGHSQLEQDDYLFAACRSAPTCTSGCPKEDRVLGGCWRTAIRRES